MSSIIPSPGTPPPTVNFRSSVYIADVWTLAEGRHAYARQLDRLFEGGLDARLVNRGTIWSDPSFDYQSWTFSIGHGTAVENHGTIVLVVDRYGGGQASFYRQDAFAFTGVDEATNGGDIFALATSGDATVFHSDGFARIVNSGLLAARAEAGLAETIFVRHGGSVVNQGGGRILAEGGEAVAIFFKGDSLDATPEGDDIDIDNAGLIEAASLDPTSASVGVWVAHLEGSTTRIVNSGTIRADYAILGDSVTVATTAQMAVEVVTNEEGGLIEGIVSLDRGDDAVTNAGTIKGEVLLGEGDDRFDSTGGVHVGVADLGWGADSYRGSRRADRVTGDNGNDTIEGGGGADLLMGGGNDDVLTGGAGNDGLFGEYGNDRLITEGGDVASGGAGSDRIVLGDYSFSLVSGDEGFDTLVLPEGPRSLDLSLVLESAAVRSIERIVLAGNKDIVVRAADIPRITEGGDLLYLDGGAGDTVHLVGAWQAAGTVTRGGVAYREYGLNGQTVLVSGEASVVIGTTPPAGAAGLDPIPAGAAAPLPGPAAGLDFTPTDFYLLNYELTQSVTVNAEELWWNDGFEPVLTVHNTGITLTNFGEIASVSHYNYPFTRTIEAFNLDHLVNRGAISARSFGHSDSFDPVLGDYMDFTEAVVNADRITNDGLIEARAVHGTAIAASLPGHVTNRGTILASSVNGAAIGLTEPSTFDNRGEVIAIGKVGAVGVVFQRPDATNAGRIEAVAIGDGAESVGVRFQLNGAGRFINSGTIIADIALEIERSDYWGDASFTLRNDGILGGRVALADRRDMVVNTGRIEGAVALGAGGDVYDGAAGVQLATIFGQAGNDQLTGGRGNDRLAGGAGDDRLDGGDGTRDVASYVDAAVAVRVSLGRAGAQNTLGAGVDTLIGMEGLEGSAFADTLVGDGGTNHLTGHAGNDVLDGKGGIDLMIGGAGDDLYFVESEGDRTVEAAGAGFDRVVSAFSHSLGAHIEQLALAGEGAIEGFGNALANILVGNAAANVLDGGAGADLMKGGGGGDLYIVDNRGDRAMEASADGGIDTVRSAVGFVLGAHVENLLLTGVGAESGVGNALDNHIVGNLAANVLRGGEGGDLLQGAGGADRLVGGAGADRLFGGDGADLFYFDAQPGDAVDSIADFRSADDTIFLDRAIFSGIGAGGVLGASAFRVGTEALEADDRIVYDRANGNLLYDADGAGGAAAVLFATVRDGLALSAADFIAYGG